MGFEYVVSSRVIGLFGDFSEALLALFRRQLLLLHR
jgi:hypothetical protein